MSGFSVAAKPRKAWRAAYPGHKARPGQPMRCMGDAATAVERLQAAGWKRCTARQHLRDVPHAREPVERWTIEAHHDRLRHVVTFSLMPLA